MALPPIPPPPGTPATGPVEVLLGHRVADPFRDLEDGDAPEVVAWDDAQSARTRAVLDVLPSRSGFRDRLRQLLDVPVVLGVGVAGDHVLALARDAGRDQAVLVVRPAAPSGAGPGDPTGAPPRVLVDPVAVEDDDTAAIDGFHPAPDGSLAPSAPRPGATSSRPCGWSRWRPARCGPT